MSGEETVQWSQQLQKAIAHAAQAHANCPNTPRDAVRFHDHKTPYIVHPLWCASSLLMEPALPEELRRDGAVALLWHDTLEDTSMPLPGWSPERVESLVREMTFESFQEEVEHLWSRSEEARLLKLYDKVSNLLDGSWMKVQKWNQYVEHTLRLASEVEARWGVLNIVCIARAIGVQKSEPA